MGIVAVSILFMVKTISGNYCNYSRIYGICDSIILRFMEGWTEIPDLDYL